MSYSCIIVEDNLLERDSLAVKIGKIESLSLKAVLADGMEALIILKQINIDIVFSDIDMPDLSGLQLLKSLKNPPVFIFVTSHTEHAAESFDLNVIDYIIKPVKIERLIKAVNKAIEYLGAKTIQPSDPSIKSINTSAPNDFIRTIDAQEYFFIKGNNSHIKINIGDVLFIESLGDFSKIIMTNQKPQMVLISLKNLEKQLPVNHFMRVHKQYIVNVLHIKHISATEIKLSNNTVIPLSSAYKLTLQDNLINKKTLTRFLG